MSCSLDTHTLELGYKDAATKTATSPPPGLPAENCKNQQEYCFHRSSAFQTLYQCIYLWKPIYIHIHNHKGVRKIQFLVVGIHADGQIDHVSDISLYLLASPHFERNRQWSDRWARSNQTKLGPHLSVCVDKLLKQWENKTSLFCAFEWSSPNKVWSSSCPADLFSVYMVLP